MSKSRQAKQARTARRRTLSPEALRLSRGAAKGLAWSGLFVLLGLGLVRLEAYANDSRTEPAPRLVWADLPLWLRDPAQAPLLEDIERSTGLLPTDSFRDDGLCARVGQTLSRNPWIAAVHRVAKASEGRLIVWCDFRAPLTLIEKHGMAYLADRQGVRLPYQMSVDFVDPGWLVLRGVEGALPEVGNHWEGQDVAAGLALVEYLQRADTEGKLPFRMALRGVDVSNYGGRRDPAGGWLRIVTVHPGALIHWGLKPGEEQPVEPPADRKLALLRKLYQREGRLPDSGPIDVRFEDRVEWVVGSSLTP